MQVGAAFTVLQVPREEAGGVPLELQAAKSRLLHTEPAAGALGLAMLAARLQGMPSHHTLHLRSVNPHVAAIFQVRAPPSNITDFELISSWVHASLLEKYRFCTCGS